jgi:hypothetical protein
LNYLRTTAAIHRMMPALRGHPMKERVSIPAFIITFVLGTIPAYAQNTAAPCSAFQKQPDGKWKALRPINIQTDKGSAVVSPGTIISPGTVVAGADVYAALQQSCH